MLEYIKIEDAHRLNFRLITDYISTMPIEKLASLDMYYTQVLLGNTRAKVCENKAKLITGLVSDRIFREQEQLIEAVAI